MFIPRSPQSRRLAWLSFVLAIVIALTTGCAGWPGSGNTSETPTAPAVETTPVPTFAPFDAAGFAVIVTSEWTIDAEINGGSQSPNGNGYTRPVHVEKQCNGTVVADALVSTEADCTDKDAATKLAFDEVRNDVSESTRGGKGAYVAPPAPKLIGTIKLESLTIEQAPPLDNTDEKRIWDAYVAYSDTAQGVAMVATDQPFDLPVAQLADVLPDVDALISLTAVDLARLYPYMSNHGGPEMETAPRTSVRDAIVPRHYDGKISGTDAENPDGVRRSQINLDGAHGTYTGASPLNDQNQVIGVIVDDEDQDYGRTKIGGLAQLHRWLADWNGYKSGQQAPVPCPDGSSSSEQTRSPEGNVTIVCTSPNVQQVAETGPYTNLFDDNGNWLFWLLLGMILGALIASIVWLIAAARRNPHHPRNPRNWFREPWNVHHHHHYYGQRAPAQATAARAADDDAHRDDDRRTDDDVQQDNDVRTDDAQPARDLVHQDATSRDGVQHDQPHQGRPTQDRTE